MSRENLNKIIFLDIDGVLVTNETMRRSGIGLQALPDVRCVNALNEITKRTGAVIVLSSSWRIYGIEVVASKLREWGVAGEVFGETRKISKSGADYYISVGRAFEIEEWLKRNTGQVSSFVILDDGAEMHHLAPFHVQTTLDHGLQVSHVQQAVKILSVYCK